MQAAIMIRNGREQCRFHNVGAWWPIAMELFRSFFLAGQCPANKSQYCSTCSLIVTPKGVSTSRMDNALVCFLIPYSFINNTIVKLWMYFS